MWRVVVWWWCGGHGVEGDGVEGGLVSVSGSSVMGRGIPN